MNRRDFLNISIPATGAFILLPGMMNEVIAAEVEGQFAGKAGFDEYDIVINGAGFHGYFAAINAAKQGMKVLIVEKRTSPGYEISAKNRPWMASEGWENLNPDLQKLLLPPDEQQEILVSQDAWPYNSIYGDEIRLFSGSIRKGLLRYMLINKVHVLLMTDVCGIVSDNKNVKGVLLACKHGLYTVNCNNFIDASDNILFSRQLLKQSYQFEKAGFVLELLKVKDTQNKQVNVPDRLGIYNNVVSLRPGKHVAEQLFLEFEFNVRSQQMEEIEQQAREIAADLGQFLPETDTSLRKQ